MGKQMDPAWWKGTVGLTAARERGDITREFENRLRVTDHTIERLGLEKELRGHVGCVNCLEWNKDGSVLASASDDLHVILWDPFRYKQLHNLATGHTGNIFSVKFISPSVLATCAADGTVRATDTAGGAPLLQCSCHCGRVKRLATAPDNPHLVWSAGEDGVVLQHDLRTAHRCTGECSNVVVNLLNHMGRYAEAKCVAVNPRRPHLLAVGANDFYVRLYDTRMIKLAKLISPSATGGAGEARVLSLPQNLRCSRGGHGDLDNNVPRAAAHYLAPGHLAMESSEHVFPKKSVTYLTFSDDGNEVLVNLGSEQIYLFDVNCGRRPVLVESFIIQHNHGCREGRDKNGTCPAPENGTRDPPATTPVPPLSDSVMRLKEMANEQVAAGNYAAAVEMYNSAIAQRPDCAILYSNRAAALMRRTWFGDTYAAIRDCYAAIALEPAHVKSHFRLAKGLMDLKRAREAHECLLYFKDKFPRHANSHAVFLLQRDISVALERDDSRAADADVSSSGSGEGSEATSVLERQLRSAARDYTHRFLGHCNTTTDIKEASFLGPAGDYVAAGSDDGSIFIWSRASGNVVRCLRGDESIVNCVQMHPGLFLLATSGIENVVRLWSPQPEVPYREVQLLASEGNDTTRVVCDSRAAAAANQQRMRSDPFEAMLLNISLAGGATDRELHAPPCRPT